MKWNIDPELIRIGPIAVRYYSLMFVIGFFTMEKVVQKIFIKNGKNPEITSKLIVYIIAGTFIGARLGHCLFYEPEYYLSNPLEILKIWEGGLASHGGYLGVIIAVLIFLRKYKTFTFLWLADVLAAPSLFVGGLIRLGNFFNSEIVGAPSNVPWAIVFERVDLLPRHPAQLYEAFGYFSISLLLFYLFHKKFNKWAYGSIISLTLSFGFLFRFFVEFFKENQSTISQGFFINMGQILSLFFVIFGISMFYWVQKKNRQEPN